MAAIPPRVDASWAKLLDPAALRTNLIAASLFLAAYETLSSSVIDQIRDFFADEYGPAGAKVSERYKSEVLSLDKSPLRASLLWLKGMSVLEDADLTLADLIRKHRNDLAHELPRFISTAEADVNLELLASTRDLVSKIDRWWIREVEIPTNPDYDGESIRDDEIHSGRTLFIDIMLHVALGEDPGALWAEFERLSRA
jgi:hypothetical protein